MRKFQLLLFAFVLLVQTEGLFAQNNVWVGQCVPPWPSPQSNIDAVELRNGNRHIDIVEHWVDWIAPFSDLADECEAIYDNGSILELAWQPTTPDGSALLTNAEINSGDYDDYITKYISDVKAWGKPIYIRAMHELNGNWYKWSPGLNGNTNASCIAAYRRIIDIAHILNATNIKWGFSIAQTNHNGNSFLGAYPGDGYIDYISIDVYNWGTNHPEWPSYWESFQSALGPAYAAVSFKGKPILISEYGTVGTGGDKVKWITDAFDAVRNSGSFDLVKAMIYFDLQQEGSPDNWRLDSGTGTLDAYITATNYTSNPTPGDDTEAPSIPADLTATPASSSQIDLSWTASTDNVGVTGYKIYRGITQIASTSSTSYNSADLEINTNYCYSVAAYDEVGNTSALCSQVCAISSSNLARDKTAYASSSDVSNTADKAIDGDSIDTKWVSGAVDPAWIYVYLGAIYSVDSVVIKWGNGYADQYTIQVSSNAISWTDGYTTSTGNGETDIITFTATNAKYVRVYCEHNPTVNAYSIFELEVHGPAVPDTEAPTVPAGLASINVSKTGFTFFWQSSTDNVDVTGYEIFKNGSSIGTSNTTSFDVTDLTCNISYAMKVRARDAAGNWSEKSTACSIQILACSSTSSNLALNQTATASSVTGGNTENDAVDGDATDTRWESDYVDPSWIYVDLGDTYSIERVVLKWEAAYADEYKIQVSSNAGDWTDVYSTTTGDGGTDDISFTAADARYVRVYCIHRATEYAYSIWEFEVYSPATKIDDVPLQPETGLVTIFPNPLNSGCDLQLSIKGPRDQVIDVTILDMGGKIVYSCLREIKAGEIISLPARLESGLYVLTVKGQNQVEKQKLVVK